LQDKPSQQNSSELDSFDALFVNSPSHGTEGTQYRDKQQGNDTVTSIISREQWAKFVNIFRNITQNNKDNNKNNKDNNKNNLGKSLEKPMPMPMPMP
jgi:hypothetical protein